MPRLPRTDALLMGLLRPVLPAHVRAGTRVPARMPLPFVLARRTGGSSIHPEFLDQAVVDVQTWAPTDEESEALSQLVRDTLYRASRYPQTVIPGVGSVAWFTEAGAPVLVPSDLDDHDTYRYQATYTINTRPDGG